MSALDVKYNPTFEEFFSDKQFYKILYGSAGSGKSYAVAQKIVIRCLKERKHSAWCFRKVGSTVEDSVFGTIKEVIETFGVSHLVRVNATKKKIYFPLTDSEITCTGLDDEEKLKSLKKVTIAWLEETTEFDKQDQVQVVLRMRGRFQYYKELIMSFNPVSELHWIKDKFFDNCPESISQKLFTHHSTFKDNHFLTSEDKERYENDNVHDSNNYRIYVLGQWGKITTGMEYYKNFNYDIHVKKTEFVTGVPIHLTFDFNLHPYITCTLWQMHKIKEVNEKGFMKIIWYMKGLKEIGLRHPKNSTEDICIELIDNYEKYLENGVVLYGDASGRNKSTSSKKTNYMIIDEYLGQYIIENRVPRSNPLKDFRHNFMNRMLFGSLPIVCEIDPDMKMLIEDLTHCLEDGERRKIKSRARDPISKIVVEKFGHFTDGMDYVFCEAFKDL